MKLSTGVEIVKIPSMAGITAEQREHCLAWIEALRSKKYTQTQKALRNTTENYLPQGHCCLGVGCDVIVQLDPNAHWGDVDNPDAFIWYSKRGLGAFIQAARDYFGVPSDIGLKCTVKKNTRLNPTVSFTSLNDSGDATFEDIAMILEVALAGGLNEEESE